LINVINELYLKLDKTPSFAKEGWGGFSTIQGEALKEHYAQIQQK
jgi:hypothetical protein